MEISKEQFQGWVANPVTQEFFNRLRELRQRRLELIAKGATIAKTADISTEQIVGHIQGIDEVLNVRFEDDSEEA